MDFIFSLLRVQVSTDRWRAKWKQYVSDANITNVVLTVGVSYLLICFAMETQIGATHAFESHLRQVERQSTGRLKTSWKNIFSMVALIRQALNSSYTPTKPRYVEYSPKR